MKLYTIQLLLAIEMPYKSGHNKTKIILYTRFGKDRVVQSLHIFISLGFFYLRILTWLLYHAFHLGKYHILQISYFNVLYILIIL